MGDTYKTIEQPAEGLSKDKGSKFLAYAYPFTDEEELKTRIAELKDLHPKARHHCWAYRLTPDRSIFRANDDGEPSGSAGKPILNTLLSNDVTNILVVVVRYFGGTLLGVPGLINAYKAATQEALNAAEVVEKQVKQKYALRFDYLQMNDVMRVMKEEPVTILKQEFDNQCLIEFTIRLSLSESVAGRLQKIEGIELESIGLI
ncbi:YigZ family protein [Siphonobacter sp. SORGH_AS_0500]|uniref:IMPACT family protein n=1 Tax=Siphonobacter sp. SORGH_AS_0500 TaxID=1864824 RepID=UPI003510ABCE